MFRVYADGVSIFDPANKALTLHSPKVTVEVGKAGQFQFIIPPTNEHYNDIQQLSTYVVVAYENDSGSFEIFRGRVFSVKTDFTKNKEVVCEGSLAYLVDTVQQVRSYKGNLKKLFTKIIARHNEMILSEYNGSYETMPDILKRKIFNVGRFEVENATVVIPGVDEDEDKYYTSKYAQAIIESMANEWITTYDYINDLIIDYVGGHLVARYDESTGTNYLDIMSDDSLSDEYEVPNQGQIRQIEFGTNLLDISQEFTPEDLCTVVIPIGDTVDNKPLTIAKASDAKNGDGFSIVKVNGKKVGIKHDEAAKKYGIIYKTHNFSNVNDANTLFKDGKAWLKKNRNIPTRFTIKAVDMTFVNSLSGIQPIRLGEMISVRSGPHDIDIELLCTKIEYDLENPANNAYTLGNPEQSLTERYRKNKNKKTKSSGGGGGGGGGGGAGAAADVAGEAQEAATEALTKIAGAEINPDPDNGSITLKTWYKDLVEGFKRAGIDIDAKHGWVDLSATWSDIAGTKSGLADFKVSANKEMSEIAGIAKRGEDNLAKLTLRVTDVESMFELFAQHKSETALTSAGIEAHADSQGSQLSLYADWKDKVDEKLSSLAGIDIKADANGAAIEQHAKWQDGVNESLANLNIRATNNESLVEQIAQFNSKTAETVASIKTRADAQESSIELLNTFRDRTTNELRGLAETKQWVNDHEAVIRSATDWYSKNGNRALTRLAQLSNDKISQILQAAEFYTQNTSALASIRTWSTETEAGVRSAAEFVNNRTGANGERDITVTSSRIEQKADRNGSYLNLIADFTDKNGKTEAAIKISAIKDINGLKSAINLEADVVSIVSKQFKVMDKMLVKNGVTINTTLHFDGGQSHGNFHTSGNLSCTGTMTIGGSLAATQKWVTENFVKK